jgi:hypothetical protein
VTSFAPGSPTPHVWLDSIACVPCSAMICWLPLLDSLSIECNKEPREGRPSPAGFEIDGQSPVLELWYRASLAWQTILLDADVRTCALVVAHNAVNQALIATAVGLGPAYFRRLLQSNAASTVLDFVPRGAGMLPSVTIDRLNQVRPLHLVELRQLCHKRVCCCFVALMYRITLSMVACQCVRAGVCRPRTPDSSV